MSKPLDKEIKILLVEDSPSDAEVLQETLHQAGAGRFQFTWVERLEDALERLRGESYDVLLLDLSLPDSSGPETFRRGQKAAPRVPIVVLTGFQDEGIGLEAVREGVQDYLVKGQEDGRQIARAIRYAVERKQAEEQLRRQQEWFRVTLTSIGDAVIAGDAGGRITFLNPVAESLTGWSREEALDQPIQRVFRIIDIQTREPADDIAARVLKENRTISLANRTSLLAKDGREVAIEDSAAPIRDAVGEVAGVVLVFHDVTERRRAQAALAAAAAEAVNERNRLDAVMEGLPVGVALLDAQGGHIRVNPAYEQIWGGPWPPPSSTGDYAARKAWWAGTGQPVQPEEWACTRALQKGETVVGQELEIQRFDGRRAFVLNSAAPIRDSFGQIAGSAVAITDITERKKMEEQLRQGQKMESIGVLAGGVAHDFNNLLTGIVGNASLVLDSMGPSDPNWELMQALMSSADRATDLTRQLLAYAGKGRFVIGPVDLSEVVRDMFSLLRASIPASTVIQVEVAEKLPVVEADSGQMQQIVMNLALNAWEAIGEREGRILIRTSQRSVDQTFIEQAAVAIVPGSYVCLEVQDNGCGMEAPVRQRVFEPFFTTKFQGRGLGLAAVHGIVRAHQGDILVYSHPGKGSVFTVLLPASGAGAPASAAAGVVRMPELRGHGTILLVDDEASVRAVARKALEGYGYTVLAAENGAEALRIFRHVPEQIALVLLDLTLPGMSGEETLKQMRAIRPETPILLSSGYNESEVMRRFAGQAPAGFIGKPYSAATLAAKVKAVAGRLGGL